MALPALPTRGHDRAAEPLVRSEAAFARALARALNAPARPTRVWRQQAGRVRVGPSWVHLAPAGAADLTGEIAPSGRRLEVETKRAGGRMSPAQRRWQARCARAGAVYVCVCDVAALTLAESVARAVAAVDEAIECS